ncbi:MAG: alanine racemase [Eubacterium sp.]|nr:alanine racemase [Eubacterium sp.]
MYFRTYATIDLDALEYNVSQVRSKLPQGVRLLGVIKANAYGHGAVEVGKFLEGKCDFFGVACVDEAMELIRAGIKTPILVLGYVSPYEYDTVIKHNIRIPIFRYEDALKLSEEAQWQHKTVPFHFCIDTGMSRIGFQVNEETADICYAIAHLPGIFAEGLFSHFATADEADLAKARRQQELFQDFVAMLEARGIFIPIKHINNSAGIINFNEPFDMCRMGIITYGLYPSEEVDKALLPLCPVLQWKATVSHIKTLPPGREISYGGTFVTERPTVVATVPVGYADGYPRCLSNKGRVIVGGCYAPILGRVCMDQLMIDVTDIPNVTVGSEAVLVGAQGNSFLTMEEVSNAAYSFNYELPCRISPRVPRVYYRGGKAVKTVKGI